MSKYLLDGKEVNGIRPLQEMFDSSKVNRTGVVEIKPIYDDPFKKNDFGFRCFKGVEEGGDPGKLVWFGLPVSIGTNGLFQFQKIQINNHRFFNLENDNDALTYHVVKHHQWIKGSPNEMNARYEIADPQIKAEREISSTKEIMKALTYLESMSKEEVIGYGRLFNMNPVVYSFEQIKASLMNTIMKDPKLFLKFSKDTEFTKAKQSFVLLEQTGIITKDPVKGYLLRGVNPISDSEEGAIRWLLNDMNVFTSLVREANSKEAAGIEKKNPTISEKLKSDLLEDQKSIIGSENDKKDENALSEKLDLDDAGF